MSRPIVESEPRESIFQARLTLKDHAMARRLAWSQNTTMSDLLRRLIRREYFVAFKSERGLKAYMAEVEKMGRRRR